MHARACVREDDLIPPPPFGAGRDGSWQMKKPYARLAACFALLAIGAVLGASTAAYLLPFGASQQTAAGSPRKTPASDSDKSKRRILYYKNPMGHPDTSPVPKKDE